MDRKPPIKKAAALQYDGHSESAPRVVASGQGGLAERILEAARAAGVPIHEDSTLTELLSVLELGSEIPAELYGLVAEVLAFIYRLDSAGSTN